MQDETNSRGLPLTCNQEEGDISIHHLRKVRDIHQPIPASPYQCHGGVFQPFWKFYDPCTDFKPEHHVKKTSLQFLLSTNG